MTGPSPFIYDWLTEVDRGDCPDDVKLLVEIEGARVAVMDAMVEAVRDHYIGLEILEKIGYSETADVVRNSLPTRKRARSGDLGEILATEYIDQSTDFEVPIRRLRFKDDPDMPMRGDDVFALKDADDRPEVMKVEAKSKASLDKATVDKADKALRSEAGRPSARTLAFVGRRLREAGRDDLAKIVEDLQKYTPPRESIQHLLFTLSGNDPFIHLKTKSEEGDYGIKRRLVGLRVLDHQDFIKLVFEASYD